MSQQQAGESSSFCHRHSFPWKPRESSRTSSAPRLHASQDSDAHRRNAWHNPVCIWTSGWKNFLLTSAFFVFFLISRISGADKKP